MLRVTVITRSDKTVLKAEGKLAGPWVHELERCWQLALTHSHPEPIVVDLTDVSYADSAGQDLIREMCSSEVDVVATGPLMTSLVDEMRAVGPARKIARR